jgi:hypothetical protein
MHSQIKCLALIFALSLAVAAQTVSGGSSQIGGKSIISVEGTIAPPPPTGILATFFAGSWNHTPPSTWPPTDSQHTKMSITGARMWDDAVKLGQIFSCTSGTCTTISGYTTLTNFINTTVPAYPMDVMYTFGDVPTGAAMGTDPNCATPTSSSCVPFNDMDLHQSNCNSDGSASPSQVHADCGNGTNAQDQSMILQLVTSFKGKIKYYEVWNEPDGAGNFWSNSATWGGTGHAPSAANQPPLVRLVRHGWDLWNIIHCKDPNARIVGPSFHGPTALTWMHYYSTTTVNAPAGSVGGCTWAAATVSGAQTFDITNCHMRGNPANQFPESFFTQNTYANTIAEINNDNLPTTLFNDEWGPENQSTIESPTPDYLAYYIGASLTLQASTEANAIGVAREWYYQIDAAGGTGNLALQGNIAGTAWDIVAGWITGGAPTTQCQQNVSIWTCPWTLANGHSAEIKWSTGQGTAFISQANGASGGSTVYDCTTICTGLTGEYVTIAGFGNANNNGSFTVTASTNNTITVNNPSGVTQTASATATYLPVTCGTGCSTVSSDGFSTSWTDLTGTPHAIVSGVVPLGAKPILIQ